MLEQEFQAVLDALDFYEGLEEFCPHRPAALERLRQTASPLVVRDLFTAADRRLTLKWEEAPATLQELRETLQDPSLWDEWAPHALWVRAHHNFDYRATPEALRALVDLA